jgi:hypothetical protein
MCLQENQIGYYDRVQEAKPGLTFKMKNVQGLFLFDKIYKLKTTM